MATDKLKVVLVEKSGENRGALEDYDAMGQCKEPECDDILKIYIKTERHIITEIGFTIDEDACSPAVASAVIATKLAKNKPVMEAYTISAEDIMAPLTTDGKFDKEHVHCAQMAEIALKRTVVNFTENLKKQFAENSDTKAQ